MAKYVKSLIEYLQAVKEISCNEESDMLVFRGHPNKGYLLQPSVFRSSKNFTVDKERTLYRKILIDYPEKFQNRDHISHLALMQHYGGDTRLLDFSRNPLVSLYFATEQNPNDDGQVIVCKVSKDSVLHHTSDKALMLACLPTFSDKDQKAIRTFCEQHPGKIHPQLVGQSDVMTRFLHEIRRECPAFECAIIGKHLLTNYFVAAYKDSQRIKVQNGLFLLFGLKDTLADRDPSLNITRINIAKQSKPQILKDLKQIDISFSTMYPSLERHARALLGKRAEWVDVL